MNYSAASVSVIVPFFNREYYLPNAIASVLNQSVPPSEVIAIDDGSSDGSAAVIKSFAAVRYHLQENQGAAAARNQGIKLAQGDFFAFLDSDDLWMSDKLSRQLSAFAANPGLDIVFGHVQQFRSPELTEAEQQAIHIPKEVAPGYLVGTMLVRREAFFRAGFFEPHLKCGEFTSWYLRAMDAGLQSEMLPEIVMRRRLHQTNYGRDESLDRSEYAKIIKASLDRRRSRAIDPKA